MRKPKLTDEMVDQAVALKGDGLSNADIIAALGINQSTWYRWLAEPKTRQQRALKEGLKKAEAEYKRRLLDTIRAAAMAKAQNWVAAAWLLERKYPDEFGRPDRRAERPADEAPRIVLGVEVKAIKSAEGGSDVIEARPLEVGDHEGGAGGSPRARGEKATP